MILKFRTGIKEHMSWKVIDKVKQVDYRYLEDPILGEGTNYIKVYPKVESKVKSKKRVAQVIIRHNDGLGEMIYTDDIVYILNNEGKTCDTITV